MDRGEFEFHMGIARKGVAAGIGMFICGALFLTFGHLSTKGFIIIGLWMVLITFGTIKALQVLRMGRDMESSGRIKDHRIGD